MGAAKCAVFKGKQSNIVYVSYKKNSTFVTKPAKMLYFDAYRYKLRKTNKNILKMDHAYHVDSLITRNKKSLSQKMYTMPSFRDT